MLLASDFFAPPVRAAHAFLAPMVSALIDFESTAAAGREGDPGPRPLPEAILSALETAVTPSSFLAMDRATMALCAPTLSHLLQQSVHSMAGARSKPDVPSSSTSCPADDLASSLKAVLRRLLGCLPRGLVEARILPVIKSWLHDIRHQPLPARQVVLDAEVAEHAMAVLGDTVWYDQLHPLYLGLVVGSGR